MKNNTNIYDIDGELIRSIDDTHKMTVEEAQSRIEYYRQKLQKLDEKDPKAVAYATYMRNLTNYIMTLYASMSPEQLKEQIGQIEKQANVQEQVNKAIEDLKNNINNDGTAEDSVGSEVPEQPAIDNESATDEKLGNDNTVGRNESDVHEERAVSQSDLLVERDNVTTVMDETIEVDE